MVLISIQEHSQESDGFQVALSFDHGPPYQVTIRDPFTGNEEEQLEWYFEQYLRFPFLRQVQARAAAHSITTYGEALFKQVFVNNPNVHFDYKTAVQAGLNTVEMEIAGSAKFHAIHWEAVKDPELPQPLAVQALVLRKNLEHPVVRAAVRPAPTINLLVVAARPHGKQDMGYRTISRPLVETLRQARVPVQVEILRPGTYRAFENHLREVTARQGVGYYHVIHFDVHGALLTYEQLTKGSEESQLLYHTRYGRGDLLPFEGARAFLAFEGETAQATRDEEQASDLVEAAELANLLISHQVPIAILNACQSGKQVGASETSLGSRLMQAGVQLVLAMGYSVTVSAAELLMKTLYQHLFAGDALSVSIRHARTELYNHKERRAYFQQVVDLEDWLLPVVYQNQPIRLNVSEFTPEERKAYFEHQAELARSAPPEPRYGFVGRDIDILQLENRLLTRRNLVLVQGMGGAGKTTLLQHLSGWWRTTSFIDQVFYFGYDERAWTRQQILNAIAKRLLTKVEFVRDFQPLDLAGQQALLAQRLRTERHLLILDNLESITGAHLAIKHPLSKKEQAALHTLLADLVSGQSLVLLGSRGGEDWLARGTFEDNVYDLPGLDPEAASILADRILEKHHATRYRQDADLQRLLKLLDGFPLALEVVLANVARQTPTDVLKALQEGEVTISVGSSEKRTENILRCIDYSHSNLSPETQRLLLCLAPFTGVIWQETLEQYTALLQQQPALSGLPFERWPEVLREAQDWGLLSPDPTIPGFLHPQPILPYFLRTRLHTPEQAEVQQAIETAFREHYNQIGRMLRQLLQSKDASEKQVGQLLTGLEYENLVRGLTLALAAQVSIINYFHPLSLYLDATQDQRRGLDIGQMVLNQLESYPADKLTGQVGAEFAAVIDDIAKRQVLLKQYAEAEQSYHKALELFRQTQGIDEELRSTLESSVYHQLGMVAYEQRQFQQAEQYYQQALQICIESNDRDNQAKAYHQLGYVAYEQRKFQQAEQYYQQALQIKIESNDRYSQAKTYIGLGTVAQALRQWEQAEQYYLQALQIEIEYNNRYEQAYTYHNLGMVAQEQRQWQQAEQYYQQALQIKIEFNARYEQADTYHQLGMVAEEQQQWQQAEQYYQHALQIYVEFNARYEQAGTYHQLGMVAEEQRQWQQARDYFLTALKIYVDEDDTYRGDIVLRSLSRLWQASNDKDLPSAIASILDATEEESETLLRERLEDAPDEGGKS